MKLREFTTETNEDGSRIVRVRARVSNQPDRDAQSEWIEFQCAVDVPTARNGAYLRGEVLRQVRDTLDLLAKDFVRLSDQQNT
jgi:hypothetical protein